MSKLEVDVSQLKVGVFIHVPLSWMEHPFMLSSFKISSEKQIEVLRGLGLTKISCDPDKSDTLPSAPKAEPEPQPEPETVSPKDKSAAEPSPELIEEKRKRVDLQKKRRTKINNCEKCYVNTMKSVKNVMKNLASKPEQAVQEASLLVTDVVQSLMGEQEFVLHLMNDRGLDETVYYHSLNVSMLAMMLGREVGLDEREMHALGLGALFHDIGKSKIPSKILLKWTRLSNAEQNLLNMHVPYGLEMAKKIKQLPKQALEIIEQHHERMDGKGFPKGLKGEQISKLAAITSIANTYDNHCNKINPRDSLTPYEALSHMFKSQSSAFNENYLSIFVRVLGVYPPGTIVQLSNDMIGLVTSVSSKHLLYPSVILYDPDIPKNEAIIYDLSEDKEIKITNSIRPSELPQAIFEYLSPRERVTYFYDSSKADSTGKNG